jgi:uncharacterized membrane protein (Fun14 family)
VAGAIVGYTAKKMAKLAALARADACDSGLVSALVSVDWNTVQHTAENVWRAHGVTLADRSWRCHRQSAVRGWFIAGFALGFKIG